MVRAKDVMKVRDLKQKEAAIEAGMSDPVMSQVLKGTYPHCIEKQNNRVTEWAYQKDRLLYKNLSSVCAKMGLTPHQLATQLKIPPVDFGEWLKFTLPLAKRRAIDALVLPWVAEHLSSV
jgi:hypothetical protein